MCANLLKWVDTKPDLSFLGVRGELPLTPADVRRMCKFIHRKDDAHWRAFLEDMMQPHKLGKWQVDWEEDEEGKPLTIRHCCYRCE